MVVGVAATMKNGGAATVTDGGFATMITFLNSGAATMTADRTTTMKGNEVLLLRLWERMIP